MHTVTTTLDSTATSSIRGSWKADKDDCADASIPKEAKRILLQCLVGDAALEMPPEVVELATAVKFTPEISSFMPTPMKMTESVSALWASFGLFATAIARKRYRMDQRMNIEVDVQAATLMLASLNLFEMDGKGIGHKEVASKAAHLDKGNISETYRAMATNIYKTSDGRYFHLHGSLNTTPMLEMLRLPQHRPDLQGLTHREAAKDVYKCAIAKWESQALEVEVNERWRQPGVTCLTMDEFAASNHGKSSLQDPLYMIHEIHPELPPVPWPQTKVSGGPLANIKILDFTKVIAGPTITKVLALLGADVLRISSSTTADATFALFDGQVGKRDTDIDLKTSEGRAQLDLLLKDADVVVDGYRPGVMEKLGFGTKWAHEVARRRGKGIVYCRENCYGWNGEWSDRSGYQQISDCVSGAAWEQGKFLGLDEPVVPLLPNSDYQTGLVGAIATMQGLMRRCAEGGSYNVEVSLTQFNNWYLRQVGLHNQETQGSLRKLHPEFHPRHDMDIFELITGTIDAMKALDEKDVGQLWDPAKFTSGPTRWSKEGETATYLDWRRIVTVKNDDGQPLVVFDVDHGSCLPGSDLAEWLSD